LLVSIEPLQPEVTAKEKSQARGWGVQRQNIMTEKLYKPLMEQVRAAG
jgi:hypothetical protein